MKKFPQSLRHGSGGVLQLDSSRVLLVFESARAEAADDLEDKLKKLHLTLERAENGEREEGAAPLHEIVNQTSSRVWARSASGEPINDEQYRKIEAAKDVAFVSAVYRFPGSRGIGGLVSPLANVLLLKGHHAAVDKHQLTEQRERSQYLLEYRYYVLANPREHNAYQVREELIAAGVPESDVEFETMPMVVPLTNASNDPLFFMQWDLQQIAGPDGWNIATGAGVTICILDQGCDLTHPDLAANIPPPQGINLGTMTSPGAPTGPHGTCCSGIAAAVLNNAQGVSGVAGHARIMPVAFVFWTDVEVATGITWAATHGARVISMSFGQYKAGEGLFPIGWNFAIIDPAIVNAVNNHNMVLVAATGNENTGFVNRYPARHPLVIAVGGSDENDNRKKPTSPDGEGWGANFGPGISVAAPCVRCTTTDLQGTAGYNSNGGPISIVGTTYPSSGDKAGNYFFEFNGTSSATPHVAGYAALIASAYPTLSGHEIRRIIERTAARVGSTPYHDVPGFPNGARTPELGYGRINVFHGLDFADVMIRDWSGDNGVEPSTPPGGDYWDHSDLVVRPTDDHLFQPANVIHSSEVVSDQHNFIYVRVENLGPRVARNVVVNVRLTQTRATPFVYPSDWLENDVHHLAPMPLANVFPTLAVGASAIARFRMSAEDSETLLRWQHAHAHPCMLAVVTADNDYAFASTPPGPRLANSLNNLAQRNLTVVHGHAHARDERRDHDGAAVDLTINIRVRGNEVEIFPRNNR
jgi:subtilisin family serine protease